MKYFLLPTFNSMSLWLTLLSGLRWVERSISCPPECLCEPWKVNCTGRNLKSFPAVNLTTKKLYVAFNGINSLPQLELSYLNELVHLDCSHNNITISSPFVFPDWQELTYLDLSYNNISHITAHTFKKLNKLLFLNLSGNRWLKQIYHNTFEWNMMLSNLDISNCDLSYLSPDLLVDHYNLQHVELSGNSWLCDCDLLEFCTWMGETTVTFSAANCSRPGKVRGTPLTEIRDLFHMDCLVHLENNDFLIMGLISFCIFFGGTFAAWLVGISSVIYSHYIAMQVDEDSEDEDLKMI